MLHLYVALQQGKALLADRLTDEEGATAVEYGVLVALIIAALIAVIGVIGDELLTSFETVRDELQGE